MISVQTFLQPFVVVDNRRKQVRQRVLESHWIMRIHRKNPRPADCRQSFFGEMRRQRREVPIIEGQTTENSTSELIASLLGKDVPVLYITEAPASPQENLDSRGPAYHSSTMRSRALPNAVRPEFLWKTARSLGFSLLIISLSSSENRPSLSVPSKMGNFCLMQDRVDRLC